MIKKYGYCILAIIQANCVYLYAKVGNTTSYEWGVFFNVSNQLVTAGYLFLTLFFVQSKMTRILIKEAGCFSLFLTLLWLQWYIPPIHYMVHEMGLSVPVLGYFCICLSVNFILYLQRKP